MYSKFSNEKSNLNPFSVLPPINSAQSNHFVAEKNLTHSIPDLKNSIDFNYLQQQSAAPPPSTPYLQSNSQSYNFESTNDNYLPSSPIFLRYLT